jgi:two-component system, OmpR family, response regulator VicR
MYSDNEGVVDIMKQRILVVDDEIPICDLLKINLEAEGYEVDTSYDGIDALKKIDSLEPNLLVLDIMLPGMNGFEICKKVIAERPIPIIMLTAKADLVDKILGLEIGADDYITKPFHTRELVARVKALLRRVVNEPKNGAPKHLSSGNLHVYPEKRKVTLSGNELDLSTKEYELLCFLMSNIDQVFSREALLEKVWDYDFCGDTRTVDVHVQRLRKKLKDEQESIEYIQTVFGVGYKMKKQLD